MAPEMSSAGGVLLRDAAEADMAAVHALNEVSVPAVNSLAPDRLARLTSDAAYCRVAVIGAQLAGFLICLAPEAPYDSPNFRWFRKRYAEFLYVDRVAVAARHQRRGIGRALYRDAAAFRPGRFPLMAAEVNLRPRNEQSLRFHARMGFEAVGSRDHGHVEVRYLVRPLPL